jgi:hypothetical protein
MRLERGKQYRTSGGDKVTIVAEMPKDGNSCCLVGTVTGNGSVLYTIDGKCPADSDMDISGLWVEDHVLYQPMKVREDGSGIVIGSLYADVDKLKAEHPSCTQIAKVTTEEGVITLEVVNR